MRNGVAEVDSSSGRASVWDPDAGEVGAPELVVALAASDDTIYIGGNFQHVGGQPRNGLAAVSATSGLPTTWNPGISGLDNTIYGDPFVTAICVRGSTAYVAGHFNSIGGQVRSGVAQVDLATGGVMPWNPAPPPPSVGWADVTSLALCDSTVLLGGWFTTMGGQERSYCAEVSLTSGLATRWNPRSSGGVLSLGATRDRAFVGGRFFSIGSQWRERKGLAAFDATTGEVKDWDPNPDGWGTWALAVTHGHVYVGGYFTFIGGGLLLDHRRSDAQVVGGATGDPSGSHQTRSNPTFASRAW